MMTDITEDHPVAVDDQQVPPDQHRQPERRAQRDGTVPTITAGHHAAGDDQA